MFTGPAYVYFDNIYIEGPDIGADVRRTEIWVAKGMYVERVRLREFTHIYGGFAGNEKSKRDRVGLLNPTIIDAVSTSPGSAAVTCAPMSGVDGFVIRGGCYGVDCAGTSPVISNNLITANVAAGVKCADGSPLVVNNTIVENGVGVETSGSARVTNNIVAYNGIGVSVSGGSPVLSHNDVFMNSSSNYAGAGPGAGDISCDPLFNNYNMGDFRLQLGSPCIDRGDPEIAPVLDGYGGLRPVDGDGDGFARVDVGAFESQFVPPYKELAELRMAGDGELMRCEEVAVTKAWNDFFYVESLDRTAGIRVEKPGHRISEEALVNVSGTVRTRSSGERYVEALAATSLGSVRVSPLGMIGKAVGGSDFYYNSLTGAGQQGVVAYRS
ncbi:MAG: right-handed parallel beta-helix repeat-containing protein [Armatimonadota bacterium]